MQLFKASIWMELLYKKKPTYLGFINFEDETNDKMISQKKLYNYVWASLIKKKKILRKTLISKLFLANIVSIDLFYYLNTVLRQKWQMSFKGKKSTVTRAKISWCKRLKNF